MQIYFYRKVQIFSIVAICLFAIFTVLSFLAESKQSKMTVLGRVQDFTLTNSDGQSFHSNNLKGRVWVANFFFTTCGDICPLMTQNLKELQQSFNTARGLNLVSITVNPEYDSPTILSHYASKITADTNDWHFLTGPREEIRTLALESFKLGSVSEPVFHSAHFSLVDRNGYIRGYYDGTSKEEMRQLVKDAAKLLRER